MASPGPNRLPVLSRSFCAQAPVFRRRGLFVPFLFFYGAASNDYFPVPNSFSFASPDSLDSRRRRNTVLPKLAQHSHAFLSFGQSALFFNMKIDASIFSEHRFPALTHLVWM